MTSPRRERRCAGEGGVSLILAMAFLSLLGVLVISLLTFTYGNVKTTQTVRNSNNGLFGADGGADIAVQLLRASSSYCPDSAAGTQTLPSQTVNGNTVTIQCQTLSGSSGSGVGSWLTTRPLVLTGYDDSGGNPPLKPKELFKTSGSTGRNEVVSFPGGPTFNAGGLMLKSLW